MPRFHTAWLMLCLAALVSFAFAPSAPAAVPDFGALSENTEMVLHIDLEKIDAASLKAAVKTTLGAGANVLDQELQTVEQKRREAVAAGIRTVLIQVLSESMTDDAPPRVTFGVKEQTDKKAIEKLIADLMPGGAGMTVSRAEKGRLTVIPVPSTQPTTQSSSAPAASGPMAADRRKLFDDAAASAGDAPAMWLFSPSPTQRTYFSRVAAQVGAQLPPPLAAALPKIVASPWLALSLKVGDAPALHLTLATTDDASAQQVTTQLNAMIDMIRDRAKAAGPADGVAALSAGMAELLRPSATGPKVQIALEGTALAKFSPAIVAGLIRGRQAANEVKSANNLRMLGQSVFLYSNENNGKYPDKLEDLKSQFDVGSPTFDDVTKNPRSADKPGYIYVKPAAKLADVRNPSETPVFFESLNGKKNPDGLIGYADGHVASVKNPVPTSQRSR